MNASLEQIDIFFIGIFSFAVSFLISPLSRYLGKKLKIFDFPNKRKIHQGIVLRAGGITIFCSFALTQLFCFLFLDFKTIETIHLDFLFKMTICSFLFFLLGLFDDLASIKPFIRFLIEITLSSLFGVLDSRFNYQI